MAIDKSEKRPPSHTEKTPSIRIPQEKHRALNGRCVAEGVTIRSVVLALINELEIDTPTAKKLMASSADSEDRVG